MYSDDLLPYHLRAIKIQCEKIIKSFDEPEVIFDIGPAKVGTEAWILRETWKHCDIIGFEPCTSRFKNMANCYPGMLYSYAISDVDGFIDGYMGKGTSSSGNDFVLNHTEEELFNYDKYEILSRTLDKLNRELRYKNIFIWADVEGAEKKVLQGSVDILRSGYVTGLNLELSDKSEVGDWCTKDEVIDFLKEFDYIYIYKNMYGGHGDYLFKKG